MNTVKLNLPLAVAGYYRMQARRPDGRVRQDTGWFPNLITDNGLNILGNPNEYGASSNDAARSFVVGAGNTPPVVGDVNLESAIAATQVSPFSDSVGWGKDADLADRYYVWRRRTRRFEEGEAAGILAEVGVTPESEPSGDPLTGELTSRALIVDSGGSPATITVLSDEVLDVTYEMRVYMPVLGAEASGTFDLSGTSYDYQHVPIGYAATPSTFSGMAWNGATFATTARSYITDPLSPAIGPEDSVILTATGLPNSSSAVNAAYTAGTLTRTASYFWGLTSGNSAEGIRCIGCTSALLGRNVYYRVGRTSDDAAIPKTATDEFTFVVGNSWARL